MNRQSWTDEQLRAQLARWDSILDGIEEGKLDITLRPIPAATVLGAVLGYLLEYEGQEIILDFSQAQQIMSWMRIRYQQYQLSQPPKTIVPKVFQEAFTAEELRP